MFRDHESAYLIASVTLVWLLTGVGVWYEIDYRDIDSPVETVAAILGWVSSAIAVTVLILATVEVAMIFAERYRARRFEEGREEGKEEGRKERDTQWSEWLKRRDAALANNEEFNEPPPSARESQQS